MLVDIVDYLPVACAALVTAYFVIGVLLAAYFVGMLGMWPSRGRAWRLLLWPLLWGLAIRDPNFGDWLEGRK